MSRVLSLNMLRIAPTAEDQPPKRKSASSKMLFTKMIASCSSRLRRRFQPIFPGKLPSFAPLELARGEPFLKIAYLAHDKKLPAAKESTKAQEAHRGRAFGTFGAPDFTNSDSCLLALLNRCLDYPLRHAGVYEGHLLLRLSHSLTLSCERYTTVTECEYSDSRALSIA
jgi:hypothetical protein